MTDEKDTSFQSLIIWKKGHQFVSDLYRMTKKFPKDEQFGVVSQMRRAAISITANIAEGYRKFGKRDKLRYFNISQGSLSEIYNYLILTRDLQYISDVEFNLFEIQLIDLDRLLNAYCAKISQNIQTSNF